MYVWKSNSIAAECLKVGGRGSPNGGLAKKPGACNNTRQPHEERFMSPIRNILLDRDGTVIHDRHYLKDPEQVELLPGALEGLRRLSAAGMRLFILTNQSGIGRGFFSEQDFLACTRRLDAMLAAHGITVERTLHCPHAPHDDCPCRKPQTGMWNTLHTQNGLLPEESVMLGDKRADVSFGLNAALAASVLVLTGKGRAEAEKLEIPGTDGLSGHWAEHLAEHLDSHQSGHMADQQSEHHSGHTAVRWKAFPERRPHWPHCVAADLDAAADWILGQTEEAGQ